MWKMKAPEDKDKFEWREKAYRKYLEHICETNGLQLADNSSYKILFNANSNSKDNNGYVEHFKYFVGQGNNSYLVLQALKKRFWWTAG